MERSLAAAGLLPAKMPEFCQKMVDSGLTTEHSGAAQVRGIAREIGNAERWPSGRRHQIANLASWVTGTEGSNPSLSAKLLRFLTSRIAIKLPLKPPRSLGWGQGGVHLTMSSRLPIGPKHPG